MPIKINVMKKLFLIFSLPLITFKTLAHQPDVSTTMLVEKENNTWVLQISASLTAFQQEIRTHFSETPYKTPEEFQQMVLQHIKNNFQLTFNGDKAVTLSDGLVKLGHETKVVIEVYGIPSTIYSAVIKNTVFEDIHKNQSALVFLKEGFNKKQFVLNDYNNHSLALSVNGNEFVETFEKDTSMLLYFIVILTTLGFLGIWTLFRNRDRKEKNALILID